MAADHIAAAVDPIVVVVEGPTAFVQREAAQMVVVVVGLGHYTCEYLQYISCVLVCVRPQYTLVEGGLQERLQVCTSF
jgi:hypothetical protein